MDKEPLYTKENIERAKEKIVSFEDHQIILEAEEGAVEFSEDHLEKIIETLRHFAKIDSELIKNFNKFISTSSNRTNGVFSLNAHIIKGYDNKWGIEFFNAGMDIKNSHRISSGNQNENGFIDNFSGTLAHEIAHGGTAVKIFSDKKFNEEFIRGWQEKFGWERIFPVIKNTGTGEWEISKQPTEGWSKNKEGKWQKENYVVMREEYTTMPEACIGGKNSYASSVDMYEDICDSVAAYLYNSSIMDKRKYNFINGKVIEFKRKNISKSQGNNTKQDI